MRSPATSRLTANPDSRHVVTAASGYRKFRQRPWRSRTDSLLTVCSRPESRGSRPPTEALKLSLRPEPAQPAGSTTRRGVRGGQGEEPAWDRLPSPSAAGEGQGHTRSRSTSRGRAPQLPKRQPHRASATGMLRQRAPEASSLQDTETSGDKLLEVTGCGRVDSSRVPAARDSDVLVAALDRRSRAYRLASGAEGRNAHAGAAGQVMEGLDFAA